MTGQRPNLAATRSRPRGGRATDARRPDVQEIWHANRRWVAAILLAHKPREVDVEDLLQEVAMRLVRHIEELADESSVRPWLRTVAVNVARTSGRRVKVRRALADPASPEELHDCDESDDRREAREQGARALSIAQSLPPEYREPLILRSIRGMSYKQIADILEVPVTTIETRLSRARRMVRDEMEREANEPVVGRINPMQEKGD